MVQIAFPISIENLHTVILYADFQLKLEMLSGNASGNARKTEYRKPCSLARCGIMQAKGFF